MPGPWESWLRSLPLPWIGDKGAALLGALGATLGDQLDTEAQAGRLEQLPQASQDPASLALAASERQIEPGPGLDDDTIRDLLAHAREINACRGTPTGLLVAFYYAGFSHPAIITQGGILWTLSSAPDLNDLGDRSALPSWVTREEAPASNVRLPASTDGRPSIQPFEVPWHALPDGPMDADGNQWTGRFVVVLYQSTIPVDSDTLARARRIVAAWRPAGRLCAGITFTAGRSVWDAPGTRTWDDGGDPWWDADNWTSYSAE